MKKQQYLAIILLTLPLLAHADWTDILNKAEKAIDIINKTKSEQNKPAPSPAPAPDSNNVPTSQPVGSSSQKQTIFLPAGTPAEATQHLGSEMRNVTEVASGRKVEAKLSNPFIPLDKFKRVYNNESRTGFFGQIYKMACEPDNSLLVKAYTMNNAGEEQEGVWRIAENGAITAKNVGKFVTSGNAKTPSTHEPIKFKDGSSFSAHLPQNLPGTDPVMEGIHAYDALHDEVVFFTREHYGVGTQTHAYRSVLTIWRQNNQGETRRVVTWHPLGKDTSKHGFKNTMQGFIGRIADALAVDKNGQIFVTIDTDSDPRPGGAEQDRARSLVYRVDEKTKKLLPVFDSKKQGNGSFFYADGTFKEASSGSVPLGKLCFDQTGNLFVLDNAGHSNAGAVIRKIDFSKNEVTTWAY